MVVWIVAFRDSPSLRLAETELDDLGRLVRALDGYRAAKGAVFWRFDPQDAVVRFDHATFDTIGAPEPLMTLPGPAVALQTAPPLEDTTWTALIGRRGRVELRDQANAILTQVTLTLTVGDARPHPGCIE
ncbi:MAG: hypothetical protein ABI647_19235 [Gemmatimonadota bacterium]